jgi:polysaccharide deacetylase family protein (PEP-CTERM system associated)
MADAGASSVDDRIVNAMSVDVEDYFQVSAFDQIVDRGTWDSLESRVCANTERLLALFERADVRATFFVLGWVAARFPALVRRMADGGHEIASHGYGHRLVYEIGPDEFRQDIRRAKALLEDISGTAVHGYRAPSYSITERSLWALDTLIDEGYRYDTSIFPIHHDRYGIPGAPRHIHVIKRPNGSIVEVPGSTVRWSGVNLPIAGGGYFRLLPYWWTRRAIARLNRLERQPAIFYLHPWEIDPDQPRFVVRPATRVRHYTNLHKTEERLSQLLEDFRFSTIGEVVRSACPQAALSSPLSSILRQAAAG